MIFWKISALLERAIPGISLKNYFPNKDQEAIEIACKIMKKLHQASIPEHHNFPHIRDWLSTLDKDWNIPVGYLQKARWLRDQLLTSSDADVLLHGDLHHDNILQDSDNWTVIDPKGVVGEPAYEVAAFIRNPVPELLEQGNAVDIIQSRIAAFSEALQIPISRITDWCFVQAVLSWVWALEDKCDAKYWKEMMSVFDSMR